MEKTIGKYMEEKKFFLIIIGIALVLGWILKGFTVLLITIALVIYYTIKRRKKCVTPL